MSKPWQNNTDIIRNVTTISRVLSNISEHLRPPLQNMFLTTTPEPVTIMTESWREATNVTRNLTMISRSATNFSDMWAPLENMYPLQLVIPFTIVYVIIFFTGVIGNISTCIVIARNKSMHTATNYYLFSLAVSDMLLLISGLPPEMYRIWSPDQYIFGQVICILQGFSAETSANATVLTITAFTVERYLAICHPFLSHTMSRLSRAVRIIIIIWAVALTLAVPQAVQFGIEVEQDGDVTKSHCSVVTKIFDHAFEISTMVFFVAPMTMITVLYVLIGRQLKKSRAKRPSMTQHNSASVAGGYFNADNGDAAKKRLRHSQAQNRVVKMLIAVVAAFFICWAPFHAQRLFAVYLSGASKTDQVTFLQLYIYLMYISGMLYYVSTCINPLLYHLMSNKYRNAFKKTFHNVCHRNPGSDLANYQYRQAHGIRLIRKNDDFLGERQQTCEAKAATSSHSSRCTPQTSETSFSSSKLENAHVLLNNKRSTRNPTILVNGNDHKQRRSTQECVPFKIRCLKFLCIGKSSYLYNTQSISNSSLKDTEELDMNASDLVNHMKLINQNIGSVV